jgi:hypothetical protein
MNTEGILIIIFQILNLVLSSIMPVISNFAQSITHSDCCGISLDRRLKKKDSKRDNQKVNREESIIDIKNDS